MRGRGEGWPGREGRRERAGGGEGVYSGGGGMGDKTGVWVGGGECHGGGKNE